MLLREIAHSRTGDKGNLVIISVIAYDINDFNWIEREITSRRVSAWFEDFIDRPATRYEVAGLGALNFVLHRPAMQGVTRSLALDAHGKCLGSALLGLEMGQR